MSSQQDDAQKKSKARELIDKIEALQREEESHKRRSSIMSIIVTLITSLLAGIATYTTIYIDHPKRAETSYEIFKKATIVALNTTDFLTLKNAELLYQGATSKQKDDPDLMADLRKALVRMNLEVTGEDNPSGNVKSGQNNSAKRIREIIAEIDKVSPYYSLPATERNLIEDINLLHKDTNIKSKLDQLAVLIGARQEELQKTQSQSRWALILAVAGIAGTLISIIISIIQGFRKHFKNVQIQGLSIE